MLQQGEKRNRRRLGRDIRRQPQENRRRSQVQRPAGGIVDLQVPAPKLGRDPAGERPIGRDEDGALAGSFQSAPQAERDDARFLFERGAIDPLDIAERQLQALAVFLLGESPPGFRRLGRAQGFREQAPAAGRRRGRLRPWPLLDLVRPEADAAQQHGHAVLGMDGILLDGGPGLLVPFALEARQHDPAHGQAGDDREQRRGRRDAARRAGGDERGLGRPLAQALGLGRKQAVAPVGRIDGAFGLQHLRPGLGQDLKKIQRVLPMLGMLAGKPLQPVEAHAFGGHLIQELRELGCQARGLVHAEGLA